MQLLKNDFAMLICMELDCRVSWICLKGQLPVSEAAPV